MKHTVLKTSLWITSFAIVSVTAQALNPEISVHRWDPPSSASIQVRGSIASKLKNFIPQDESSNASVASDDLVIQIQCPNQQHYCDLTFQEPTWKEDSNWSLTESSLSMSFEKQRGKVFIMRLKMPEDPVQNAYIVEDQFTFFVSKNGTIAFTIDR